VSTTIYMCLVIIAFFALVLHAIHQEEKRKADRRQQDHPHAAERRKVDRRRKSAMGYLAWALQAPWARFKKD
jgi:hypothetical protein